MATFNDCATQVKAVLDAISGFPTTDIRKLDVIHPRDTLPIVIISLGTDQTDVWATLGAGTSTDQGSTGKLLRLIIAYYSANLGDVETNLSTVPDYWQAAKRALNEGGLSGVTGAWNVQIETNEAWEGDTFKEGHEVSRMVVNVDVAEARNS
jgi:hypothetical protein